MNEITSRDLSDDPESFELTINIDSPEAATTSTSPDEGSNAIYVHRTMETDVLQHDASGSKRGLQSFEYYM